MGLLECVKYNFTLTVTLYIFKDVGVFALQQYS